MNDKEKESEINEFRSQIEKVQEEGSGIIDCGGPEKSHDWNPFKNHKTEEQLQREFLDDISKRDLRIKSFEFAKFLKPDSESSNSGIYDVEKYISDANKIYDELIK